MCKDIPLRRRPRRNRHVLALTINESTANHNQCLKSLARVKTPKSNVNVNTNYHPNHHNLHFHRRPPIDIVAQIASNIKKFHRSLAAAKPERTSAMLSYSIALCMHVFSYCKCPPAILTPNAHISRAHNMSRFHAHHGFLTNPSTPRIVCLIPTMPCAHATIRSSLHLTTVSGPHASSLPHPRRHIASHPPRSQYRTCIVAAIPYQSTLS